ncbi:hypothetical protein Bca101_004615 [Brassica carinata]
MLSQKWDHGIGYELHNGAEDQQRKDLGGSELRSSDLRRFERVFERWNWGFLRMLRSQLLGNGGDMKEGETARKRMKISVPHFDNSALIKTYSKSLIGRCMNPPEQEMKALIQNVPKIWKQEERVVGTDLGFGKFRFDFETEEEIDTEKCPLAKKASPEKKREGREGNGGWYDGGKHDDRARSYKGVVINGNQNQQHRERDGRDYYGKGKGKMVEEADSKWVKVADRGNKGPFTNHRSFRGEGDGSRHRSSRREEPRAEGQGHKGSNRSSSGQSGAPKEVVQEEGEIKNPKESEKTLPSQDFQEELAKTQAVGSEVISDPMDAEEGLQMIKSLIVEPSTLEDDKVLYMDECRAICLEHGIDMDAADDLPDCSDGEFEEMLKEQDDEEAIPADLENENMEVEKAHVKGDVAKKQRTRKRLFKPSTAGSTKMRIASALVSPRKRAPAKVGTRHEDHSKHQEIKGTSNPKTGMKNP